MTLSEVELVEENVLDIKFTRSSINIPPKGCGVPVLLEYFMKRINLGRSGLASRTGVTEMHVSRWMRGYMVYDKYLPKFREAFHLNDQEYSRLEEEIKSQENT